VEKAAAETPNERIINLLRAYLLLLRQGDLAAAQRSLAQVPADFLKEDRAVNITAVYGYGVASLTNASKHSEMRPRAIFRTSCLPGRRLTSSVRHMR